MNYSDLESILVQAFQVGPENEKTFKGRLGNMRRPDIGCIPGLKHEGTGRRIEYTRSNLRHLYLAVKLNLLGLDPRLIGKCYSSGKFLVDEYFDIAERDLPKFKSNEEIFRWNLKRDRNEKMKKLRGKTEREIELERFEQRKAILVMLFLHEEDSIPTFSTEEEFKIYAFQGTAQGMMENLVTCANSRFSPLTIESGILLNFTEMAISLKSGYLKFKSSLPWEDFMDG